MIIDFKSTHDKQGVIHFCNEYGETIKTYDLSFLEAFVMLNSLNVIKVPKGGTGMVSDPNTDFVEQESDVNEYIDDNWFEVTEMFYAEMNPNEFQSNNTPNQLNSKKI